MGKQIGLRIKFIRECIGISQKELSERAGLTQAAICQYESGERKPDLDSLFKLKSALTVGWEVLLNNVSIADSLND